MTTFAVNSIICLKLEEIEIMSSPQQIVFYWSWERRVQSKTHTTETSEGIMFNPFSNYGRGSAWPQQLAWLGAHLDLGNRYSSLLQRAALSIVISPFCHSSSHFLTIFNALRHLKRLFSLFRTMGVTWLGRANSWGPSWPLEPLVLQLDICSPRPLIFFFGSHFFQKKGKKIQ